MTGLAVTMMWVYLGPLTRLSVYGAYLNDTLDERIES